MGYKFRLIFVEKWEKLVDNKGFTYDAIMRHKNASNSHIFQKFDAH